MKTEWQQTSTWECQVKPQHAWGIQHVRVCLCLQGLAVLHMHYMECDGVIWTDSNSIQCSLRTLRQFQQYTDSVSDTSPCFALLLCLSGMAAKQSVTTWCRSLASVRMHGSGTGGMMPDTWETFMPCPLHHVRGEEGRPNLRWWQKPWHTWKIWLRLNNDHFFFKAFKTTKWR